jgi:hypothetical protein
MKLGSIKRGKQGDLFNSNSNQFFNITQIPSNLMRSFLTL